jgi:excisionase family DNA binding protein
MRNNSLLSNTYKNKRVVNGFREDKDMLEKLRMTSREAAVYLGMSDSWVRKQRVRGTGPAFIRLPGGSIRYHRITLDEWMEEQQAVDTLGFAR